MTRPARAETYVHVFKPTHPLSGWAVIAWIVCPECRRMLAFLRGPNGRLYCTDGFRLHYDKGSQHLGNPDFIALVPEVLRRVEGYYVVRQMVRMWRNFHPETGEAGLEFERRLADLKPRALIDHDPRKGFIDRLEV